VFVTAKFFKVKNFPEKILDNPEKVTI
jgi:hypothetical protein